MVDQLLKGHLNELIKLAVSLGMSVEKAIYCSTYTPARRMHLEDRGMIAPGRLADFIVLSDLNQFTIHSVYKKGECVWGEDFTYKRKARSNISLLFL